MGYMVPVLLAQPKLQTKEGKTLAQDGHSHASGPHKRVHIQHTIIIHMRVDPTSECIFNAYQSSTCKWTPQASVHSMHTNHPHVSGPHKRVYIQCIPIIHMRVDPTGECIYNALHTNHPHAGTYTIHHNHPNASGPHQRVYKQWTIIIHVRGASTNWGPLHTLCTY